MPRIDLMFDSDGDGCLAFGKSVDEDREAIINENFGGDEIAYAKDATPIVAHITMVCEPNSRARAGIEALMSCTNLDIEANVWGNTHATLEILVTKVFKAGIAYARFLQVSGN